MKAYQTKLGPEYPQTWTSYSACADVLSGKQEFQMALEIRKKVVEGDKRTLKPTRGIRCRFSGLLKWATLVLQLLIYNNLIIYFEKLR